MKEWKDKEVITGIIIIIFLGIIAIGLLIRRETKSSGVETFGIAEETAVSEEKEPAALAEVQMMTKEYHKDSREKENQEISLYDILGNEKYTAPTLTEQKQEDNQLKELYDYWDSYKLDAVEELVRLERLQKISQELEGKNKYYYYGSVDRLGRPAGKGLAVYENNTYYFGEWQEGLRHGKGMWLEVAIYTEENEQYNLGVVEHSYNGQWSRDLPNGEGQEHFSYDYDILNMESTEGHRCIANVLGNFKDGYYDGEMYVMTVDAAGNTTDWGGICKSGTWELLETGAVSVSIWESYEKDAQGNSQYQKILPQENQGYGIRGLKK